MLRADPRAAIGDPRDVLDRPAAYLSLMKLLGADRGMRRFVDEALKPRPGEHVLDLGCGPGRLAAYLPDVSYFGVDQSERYLQQARLLYPKCSFERLDFSADLAFAETDFDLIVACAVLHHLSDETADRLLDFCAKRLRPGGRLVTLDCVRDAGQNPIARLLVKFDRGKFVRDEPGYLALVHRHFDSVQPRRYSDLLRIPYPHLVLECRK